MHSYKSTLLKTTESNLIFLIILNILLRLIQGYPKKKQTKTNKNLTFNKINVLLVSYGERYKKSGLNNSLQDWLYLYLFYQPMISNINIFSYGYKKLIFNKYIIFTNINLIKFHIAILFLKYKSQNRLKEPSVNSVTNHINLGEIY